MHILGYPLQALEHGKAKAIKCVLLLSETGWFLEIMLTALVASYLTSFNRFD